MNTFPASEYLLSFLFGNLAKIQYLEQEKNIDNTFQLQIKGTFEILSSKCIFLTSIT